MNSSGGCNISTKRVKFMKTNVFTMTLLLLFGTKFLMLFIMHIQKLMMKLLPCTYGRSKFIATKFFFFG